MNFLENMSNFTTLFDDIVRQFGGSDQLCALLGVGRSALSNYRKRGYFPATKQNLLNMALADMGWAIDMDKVCLMPIATEQRQRILLIITGGIAAYKALDLARRLIDRGYKITGVMSASAHHFITPLSLSALTGEKSYGDLFSLTDEAEMGHIQLARQCDLVLVAPASANFIARLAGGFADDLASCICLATEKPILLAPAMNPVMWAHPATCDNLALLKRRGIDIIPPEIGDTACGEVGRGRLATNEVIITACESHLRPPKQSLSGLHILITAGPTFEPIDPVRYIGNHSSGKQGYALADACIKGGANVTLVSGPSHLEPPKQAKLIKVTTARQMYQACHNNLPADIAICTAAVADWHVVNKQKSKIKKTKTGLPHFELAENPDILATLATSQRRPNLLIGFAAETENLIPTAKIKRQQKKCNWIIANEINDDTPAFGADDNQVSLITETSCLNWKRMSKKQIAEKLVNEIEKWRDGQNN